MSLVVYDWVVPALIQPVREDIADIDAIILRVALRYDITF
jgi:hypothetical protein